LRSAGWLQQLRIYSHRAGRRRRASGASGWLRRQHLLRRQQPGWSQPPCTCCVCRRLVRPSMGTGGTFGCFQTPAVRSRWGTCCTVWAARGV
jgi:hypothetical protein